MFLKYETKQKITIISYLKKCLRTLLLVICACLADISPKHKNADFLHRDSNDINAGTTINNAAVLNTMRIAHCNTLFLEFVFF